MSLLKQISIPHFMSELTLVNQITFYQGHFVEAPSFTSKEQLLCALQGQVSAVLVSPLHWQETYSG